MAVKAVEMVRKIRDQHYKGNKGSLGAGADEVRQEEIWAITKKT